MPNPLLILDRDGVINIDSDAYIKSPQEWHAIDGSIQAIADLSRAGFDIVVATNQSGIARQLFDHQTLELMHQKMTELVAQQGGSIKGIFYCPHHPAENCVCRKPLTGLLDQIEQSFKRSVKGAFFIGDSLKDLQAATKKSCIPVLVRTGKGSITESQLIKTHWDELLIFDDLFSASHYIINQL